MDNIIIRNSKIIKGLILSMNCEKVYRVYLNGEEKSNNMEYNNISDYFSELERIL